MELISLVCSVAFMLVCFGKSTQAVCDYNQKARDAREGEIPYIVQIRVLHPHTGRFMPICAGAIISKHDVLTNAVCASACKHPPHCKLYVGRINLNSGGTEVKIKGAVWHETFNELDLLKPRFRYSSGGLPRYAFNFIDLGIIYTEEIQITETVQIIPLVNHEHEPRLLKVSGWGGETTINGMNFTDEPKQQDILKYGSVMAYYCAISQWGGGNNLICVIPYNSDSEVHVCVSDMGTPWIYEDTNELVGIGSVDFFANIFPYCHYGYGTYDNMDFINKSMYVNSADFIMENFKDEKYTESSSNTLPDAIHMIIAFSFVLIIFG